MQAIGSLREMWRNETRSVMKQTGMSVAAIADAESAIMMKKIGGDKRSARMISDSGSDLTGEISISGGSYVDELTMLIDGDVDDRSIAISDDDNDEILSKMLSC